jgi:hypothetical protein
MRVNVIAKKTITVDGKLDDWQNALPQIIRAKNAGLTTTQAAWFPFVNFDQNTQAGVASGFAGVR